MSRNYLEAFVIILIAAGLGFFLVLPKYSKLQEIKLAIAEKNAEIENRQEYFAELSQAGIELAQYEANMEKIETAFPETVDAPALMNFVQAAAMQSGLIVKGVTYGGTSESKSDKEKKVSADTEAVSTLKLKTYSVGANFIGSYPNFKDFLARIEYSSRLISTDSISVSKESVNTSESAKKTAANNSPAKIATIKTVDGKEVDEQSIDPVLNFKVTLSANYYQ